MSGGDAGYVVGLVRHGEEVTPRDWRTVRIGQPVLADEIDLSDDAALLWADYARELTKTEEAGSAAPEEDSGDGAKTDEGASDGRPGSHRPTVSTPEGAGTRPARTHEVIHKADISTRFNRAGLFNLVRALSKLRDLDARVEIDITVRVEGELDRTEFRNAVIEPIDEDGHDVKVQTA